MVGETPTPTPNTVTRELCEIGHGSSVRDDQSSTGYKCVGGKYDGKEVKGLTAGGPHKGGTHGGVEIDRGAEVSSRHSPKPGRKK